MHPCIVWGQGHGLKAISRARFCDPTSATCLAHPQALVPNMRRLLGVPLILLAKNPTVRQSAPMLGALLSADVCLWDIGIHRPPEFIVARVSQ